MKESRASIRSAFVKEGGGVELREVPAPKTEEGSIVVRMECSGVCGTDLEKLSGRGITSSVLGHEVSGTITESLAEGFAPGDRVVPHHHVCCNSCEVCLSGAETMCESFRKSNFVPGGFADEFLVPSYNVSHGGVHKIPADMSFEEASFAEPLGCCIRGLNHAGVINNSNPGARQLRQALVVGVGPIGLLHMELLRSAHHDVNIAAVDVISKRLEFAEKHEKATAIDASKLTDGSFAEAAKKISGSLGYDLVIVATGSEKAFGEAIKCSRKSGSILLFGAPHKGAVHQLDLARLFLDELTIATSYSTTDVELESALSLLQNRRISVGKFVTGRYPLDDIEEAMESARSAGQVKVLITA